MISSLIQNPSAHQDAKHLAGWQRWVQKGSILVFLSVFLLSFPTFILVALYFPRLWPIVISYAVFILFDPAPEAGGRKSMWFRSLSIWHQFRAYFPAQLIKEADLDPTRNYIFGYHPHGVLTVGALINFGTEATGFAGKFPDLNCRLLTMSNLFNYPFFREILLSLGITSVSKRSMRHILTSGPGNSCAVVVGGLEESLLSRTDQLNLYISKRFGFIRIAIETGSDLVPVFGFGEPGIYDQMNNDPGTFLHRLQRAQKRIFGVCSPMVFGRSILEGAKWRGVLPNRVPLTAVVGSPISVTRCSNPTQELIRHYHKLYVDRLVDLYERNRQTYSPTDPSPELTLL